MHAAFSVLKERALRVSRNAQLPQIFGLKDEPRLEIGRRHFQKGCKRGDVFLGQVNEALLVAAFRAARLAFESELPRRHGLSCLSSIRLEWRRSNPEQTRRSIRWNPL